jgi:hypothetical protein
MEDEYDRQRGEAIEFLEFMKGIVGSTIRYQGLTEKDRKALTFAESNFYAFEQLDKHFIAPHAASKSSQAAFGYEMLSALMRASFYAGSRGTVTKSAFRFVDNKAQSSRGSLGGLAGGKTNQEKQAKGWGDEALRIAKKYAEINTGYSQDGLATEIKFKLDDLAPGHRQIKRSRWVAKERGHPKAD